MDCRKGGIAPLGGKICEFASQAWLFMQFVQTGFIYKVISLSGKYRLQLPVGSFIFSNVAPSTDGPHTQRSIGLNRQTIVVR